MTPKPKVPILFRAEDFDKYFHPEGAHPTEISETAQQIFESWLRSQTVISTIKSEELGVYGPHYTWTEFDKPITATHVAYIICETEIDRKPCEHEPVPDKYKITGNSHNPILDDNWHCKRCGVKLKARWEVASDGK